jgi:hypothetical protein
MFMIVFTRQVYDRENFYVSHRADYDPPPSGWRNLGEDLREQAS